MDSIIETFKWDDINFLYQITISYNNKILQFTYYQKNKLNMKINIDIYFTFDINIDCYSIEEQTYKFFYSDIIKRIKYHIERIKSSYYYTYKYDPNNIKYIDSVINHEYIINTIECESNNNIIDIFKKISSSLNMPYDAIIETKIIEKEVKKIIPIYKEIEVEKIINVKNYIDINFEDCCICLNFKSSCAFDCGHICICENCKNEYKENKCPLCRKKSVCFKIIGLNNLK